MRRLLVLLLPGSLACGTPPATPGASETCASYRPLTCEEADAAPDRAPALVGDKAVEVAVDLDAASQSGPGRLRYWLTGSEPLDLRLNVRTQAGQKARGAFFLDGAQVPVRIDGGDPVLTFEAPDGPSILELAAPVPTGVSVGSLVLWLPGQRNATTGHTVTLIHDGCGFAGDLPLHDAEVTDLGEPTLLDPETGNAMAGEPAVRTRGSLAVRPCVGGTRSVVPSPSCSTEDYLLVALIDGTQGWFAGDVRALRLEAPPGSFAESRASLQVPDDGKEHEVLFVELPSYRRWQVPGSVGTLPVELGRYMVTPM